MSTQIPGWFTELVQTQGTAFSLRTRQKLHEEQSSRQFIEVWETDTFGRLLCLDGHIRATERDHFIYHEMLVHAALFTHRRPERVAILGGGDCAALTEVLKHQSVREVWLIESDERVTRVAERFFPAWCVAGNDPRVSFFFGDERLWLEDAVPGTFDVLILDRDASTGDDALDESRRIDFYRSGHLALAEGGLLMQASGSPLPGGDVRLVGLHQQWRKAGFDDVQTLVFPGIRN